ncbi:O(6)-methylguanine-induced apoptosis 2 isoform X2 [Rhinoraja longicauda]
MVDYIQQMAPQNKQIHKTEYKMIKHLPTGNPSKGWQSTTSTSTIPTKYQTVMYGISEKKGFGSQARRFDDDFNQGENPGPGTYDNTHVPLETFSTSFSKRGMGGLASKVSNVFLGKVNNMSAESAFLSKTGRVTAPQLRLIGPSPCHYRINTSLTKESPKAIISSFKSKTMRMQYPSESMSPGPATYQPFKSMTEERTHFAFLHPWKKHYMCISAPPFPVNRDPTPPGPGYYDVVDFHDPPKHYMTSAAFVSNTSRWTGNVHDKDIPGPASYVPKRNEKQSFLLNVNRKWVPL